jgi:two-component sensor histidine kinase
MIGYKLIYLASLITFTFGALTFSVLTLVYWREKSLRRQTAGRSVFPLFTVVCAVAFLINLLLQIAASLGVDIPLVTGLTLLLQLVTGMLPAFLFHIIYEKEAADLPSRRFWPWLLTAFYVGCALAALSSALDDAGLLPARWSDQADNLPVAVLGASGTLGLLVQILSRRPLSPVEGRHRRWMRVLLVLTLLFALADWAQPGPFVRLLPDYLVLGFFCVTLYYRERLVFLDLFIKRGVFFAVALVALTVFFVLGSRNMDRLSSDWSLPWICALALTPLWMTGPWIFRRLEQLVDQVWLRRRYSPADAERRFVRDIQACATQDELRQRAARSLSEIFQAPAKVQFGPADVEYESGGAVAELEHDGSCMGWLILAARHSSIPYMSDDRRLLQSLARTLSFVLENVRFREQRRQQEDREQELRWLASRAELKALRAQINPHFLFNALNAIAGLIHEQPAMADETIEQLAQVFRYTLRTSEKEWVRLDEELDFVASYLRVEQARFGRRLRVVLETDPAAAAIPIPAMCIQPLVENAIRHGVSAVEGTGTVTLRSLMSGEALTVEVFDNGPGFPSEFAENLSGDGNMPAGHGLRNVIERLRGYYGQTAGLQWQSEPGNTRVCLTIPYNAGSPAGGSEWKNARSDRR